MKISDLCLSERPREKAVSHGVGALSNAELLAVLLRSGTKEKSALEMAQSLLGSAGGSLVDLSRIPMEGLFSFPGIKSSKAVTLLAAFELGRRLVSESSNMERCPLTGAEGVFRRMIPRLKGVRHEECWVLFVNKSQYVTGDMRMSSGGDDSTTIDVRCILREALSRYAQAIVLVHNHPSGNPLPGEADIRATKSLRRAAEAMDILLLDHVIICDDCYYSFCDERIVRPGNGPAPSDG